MPSNKRLRRDAPTRKTKRVKTDTGSDDEKCSSSSDSDTAPDTVTDLTKLPVESATEQRGGHSHHDEQDGKIHGSHEGSHGSHGGSHGSDGEAHGSHGESHYLSLEDYEKYYESEECNEDHENVPDECLVKYQQELLGEKGGKLKILFPLCGQVYDMKYVADLGHRSVGIDFAKPAIENFFRLNKIPYSCEDADEIKGKIYKSKQEGTDIKIYYCDVYNFKATDEDRYDAIWDAGAMHSLQLEELQKYVDVLKPLLKKNCPWMITYPLPIVCGNDAGKDKLEEIFGTKYGVKDLGVTKTDGAFFKKVGITGFRVFLVKEE